MTTVGIFAADGHGWTRLGDVTLADGKVTVDPAVSGILEQFYVPDLNDPKRRRLLPEDGAVYVEMLPRAMRGSALRAAVDTPS